LIEAYVTPHFSGYFWLFIALKRGFNWLNNCQIANKNSNLYSYCGVKSLLMAYSGYFHDIKAHLNTEYGKINP
jgi:hypothetical protein